MSLTIITDSPNETTYNSTHLSTEPAYETIHLEDQDVRHIINPVYDSGPSKLNVSTSDRECIRVNKILHMQGRVPEKDHEETGLLNHASKLPSVAYVNAHVTTVPASLHTGYSTLIRPDKKLALSPATISAGIDPSSKSKKIKDDKSTCSHYPLGTAAAKLSLKLLRSSQCDVSLSNLQQVTIDTHQVLPSTDNPPRSEKRIPEQQCSNAEPKDDPVNSYSIVTPDTPPFCKVGPGKGYSLLRHDITVPGSHFGADPIPLYESIKLSKSGSAIANGTEI